MRKIILAILIIIFSIIPVHTDELNDKELYESIKMSFHGKYSEVEINDLLSKGVWNKDKTAIVIIDISKTSTLIYVFLKQDNGSFSTFNISFLEKLNFGKLGRKRGYYDKFELQPIIHEKTKGFPLAVGIRTQAWKDGQRYTVVGKTVSLEKDGSMYIWPGEIISNY